MDKKALFVASMPFMEQHNTGGVSIMNRNYQILCTTFKKENVDICVVNSDDKFLGDNLNLPQMVWIEGNIRGIKRTLNEMTGHNYITNSGEKKLKTIILQKNYDLVWLDSPQYGRIAKFIKENVESSVITFAHNVESEYIKIYCKLSWKKPHYYAKIHEIEKNEKDAIMYSDEFICISSRDRSEYEKKFNCKLDTVFPVTLNDTVRNADLKTAGGEYFMFVGSYFKPNEEAVKWIVENVAQCIKQDIYIVGRNMEKMLEGNQTLIPNNVRIVGGVDDLGEYYRRAIAIIMPIFSGSGMKVKTAEAMMYGKPIVATDEALIGYNVDDIEGIYRCNSAEDFTLAMNKIYQNGQNYYKEIRGYYLEFCDTKQLFVNANSLINGLLCNKK